MGHVRVNQPPWRAGEVLAAALASRRPVARLTEELAIARPGWRPVPVRSGRGALALVLGSLDLPPGSGVAVPAYVCPAVVSAVWAAGLRPIPLATAPGSFAVPVDAVADAAHAGRVVAIVAPGTHGVDADVGALAGVGLPVVDDAAYLGFRPGGHPFGFRGAAGVWSANHKAITGVGGGVAWLPLDRPAPPAGSPVRIRGRELLRLSELGIRAAAGSHLPRRLGGGRPPLAAPAGADLGPHFGPHLGTDAEAMSGAQAALIRAQWHRSAELAARTRSIVAAIVDAAEACGLELVAGADPDLLVHVVPLLHPGGPDAALDLRVRMWRAGVQTADPYPVPEPTSGRHASATADRLVLVPCGAGRSDADVARVVDALARR